MRRFVILTNYAKDTYLHYTQMIRNYLELHGAHCWVPPYVHSDTIGISSHYDLSGIPDDVECALSLGGDGTLLQAARDLLSHRIPILGINLGTLGFLTSVESSELPHCLESLLRDEYNVDIRSMLLGRILRGDRVIFEDVALNDIVAARAGQSRMVDLEIYVNDELMSAYSADGVIVSTPTGATGYNLSAGGPVIYPQADVIVITPICPHSLQTRSVVISGHDQVELVIRPSRHMPVCEAMATFDGKVACDLDYADRIMIEPAQEKIQLIKLKDRSFYQLLRNKIGGA